MLLFYPFSTAILMNEPSVLSIDRSQEKHELRKWLDNVKGPHIILFTAPWLHWGNWGGNWSLED
jgi:hypothetical protein